MIKAIVRKLPWANALFLLAGVVLALVLMPLLGAGIATLQDLYDEGHPVAKAKLAKVEYLTPREIRFQLWVTRQRDCETLQMVAMTGASRSAMQNATELGREDGGKPMSYPVGVTILSKPWILSPVYGPHLALWGYYDCDKRIVKSLLIDEVIPQ